MSFLGSRSLISAAYLGGEATRDPRNDNRSKKGSGGILIGAKIGPAPRYKNRKAYPSVKGTKISPLDTKIGLFMHA